jgi:hypothetical protein
MADAESAYSKFVGTFIEQWLDWSGDNSAGEDGAIGAYFYG